MRRSKKDLAVKWSLWMTLMCLKIRLITIVIRKLNDLAVKILPANKGVVYMTAYVNLLMATFFKMVLAHSLPFPSTKGKWK